MESLPSEQRNKFLVTDTLNKEDEDHQPSATTTTHEINHGEFIKTLPKVPGWLGVDHLYLYEGFWYSTRHVLGSLSAHHQFSAQPSDIILCSPPKSGTTWLKALAFAIVTRTRFATSPLLTNMPHACVPFLELDLAQGQAREDPELPLVATHIPYSFLPKSIIAAKCKIVYIYRDPKDTFVSLWHFRRNLVPKDGKVPELEEAFEMFCEGKCGNGPYWDHVLGYLKASLESPENVLILKYEDMMMDGSPYVKKMAEFMGCSFTLEEEKNGVVNGIVDLCSFENLSNLDVNKKGWHRAGTTVGLRNRNFFRKGIVGDWKNYLTDDMAKKLDCIFEQSFIDCGLNF